MLGSLLMKLILLILFTAAVMSSPLAAKDQDKDAAKNQSASGVSAQQAAKIVKRRFSGKVLKISTQKIAGHPGYKVKLIKDNGHIIYVLVDARSGKIKG